MSSRDQILNKLRSTLDRTDEKSELNDIRQQLITPKPQPIPNRGNPKANDRIPIFEELALAANCSIERVSTPQDIPRSVANWLAHNNLPPSLVIARNPTLEGLSWSDHSFLSIRTGIPEKDDEVGLNLALAGISETGTLMFASSPQTPTSLNFLPENHIAIVGASTIVGSYEEAIKRLKPPETEQPHSQMPRVLNFVTGPSRTGDIALKLELGAHGPKRLHIVIVNAHL
tara:strand:+ start:1233 stop:1919 length:687 start_codon:yes stop_codon:yes gene_type:complete